MKRIGSHLWPLWWSFRAAVAGFRFGRADVDAETHARLRAYIREIDQRHASRDASTSRRPAGAFMPHARLTLPLEERSSDQRRGGVWGDAASGPLPTADVISERSAGDAIEVGGRYHVERTWRQLRQGPPPAGEPR